MRPSAVQNIPLHFVETYHEERKVRRRPPPDLPYPPKGESGGHLVRVRGKTKLIVVGTIRGPKFLLSLSLSGLLRNGMGRARRKLLEMRHKQTKKKLPPLPFRVCNRRAPEDKSDALLHVVLCYQGARNTVLFSLELLETIVINFKH